MNRQPEYRVSLFGKMGARASVLILTATWAMGCVLGDESDAILDEAMEEAPPLGPQVFTPYFSEEDPAGLCSSTRLMHGFECEGSYCDDLRMDCTAMSGVQGESSWSDYFSEEGSYPADAHVCSPGEWVTGMDCNGSYCDNVAVRCTEVRRASDNRLSTATGCSWSEGRSEEDPAWSAGASNRFVRGVRCDGSNCDNMSFYVCTLGF
jgi:hypothetical protein